MKKTFFTILFSSCFCISLFAQDINVHKAGEVIVKETTTIYDRNDVVKEGVINPELPSRYKGVHELAVLPQPIEQEGMATLSFWIKESDVFKVVIEDMTGEVQEEHRIGNLPAGAHQLMIDMAGIQSGNYNLVVKGEKQSGEAKFVIGSAQENSQIEPVEEK